MNTRLKCVLHTGIGDFSVSGAALTASATPGDAKNRDASCLTDYVMIAQGHAGSQASSLKVDRYCGQALGACEDAACEGLVLGPVRSSVLPFTLGVVTDGDEAGDTANRGFQLFYTQQLCP